MAVIQFVFSSAGPQEYNEAHIHIFIVGDSGSRCGSSNGSSAIISNDHSQRQQTIDRKSNSGGANITICGRRISHRRTDIAIRRDRAAKWFHRKRYITDTIGCSSATEYVSSIYTSK